MPWQCLCAHRTEWFLYLFWGDCCTGEGHHLWKDCFPPSNRTLWLALVGCTWCLEKLLWVVGQKHCAHQPSKQEWRGRNLECWDIKLGSEEPDTVTLDGGNGWWALCQRREDPEVATHCCGSLVWDYERSQIHTLRAWEKSDARDRKHSHSCSSLSEGKQNWNRKPWPLLLPENHFQVAWQPPQLYADLYWS